MSEPREPPGPSGCRGAVIVSEIDDYARSGSIAGPSFSIVSLRLTLPAYLASLPSARNWREAVGLGGFVHRGKSFLPFLFAAACFNTSLLQSCTSNILTTIFQRWELSMNAGVNQGK